MKEKEKEAAETKKPDPSTPCPKDILEEIEVEDLTVDGICGVY